MFRSLKKILKKLDYRQWKYWELKKLYYFSAFIFYFSSALLILMILGGAISHYKVDNSFYVVAVIIILALYLMAMAEEIIEEYDIWLSIYNHLKTNCGEDVANNIVPSGRWLLKNKC